MSRRYFTSTEIDFLKENFIKHGTEYCAKKLERTSPYVAKKAYSLGLRRRTSEQWKFDKSPKLVNIEYFHKMTSPTIAYILGFIWADGNVSKTKHRITITIKYEDGESLKNTFLLYIPFHIHISNSRHQFMFYINDINLHSFLVDNDYLNKSVMSPSKILSKIPQHLHHYFFRGYFDGDGCFTNKSNCCVSFTGSYEQNWTDIECFIKSFDIIPKIIRRAHMQSKSSFIYFYGKQNCKRFLDALYSGKEVGLARKSHLHKTLVTSL